MSIWGPRLPPAPNTSQTWVGEARGVSPTEAALFLDCTVGQPHRLPIELVEGALPKCVSAELLGGQSRAQICMQFTACLGSLPRTFAAKDK